TAAAVPARRRARVTITGAARARFVVSAPAATPGTRRAIKAAAGTRGFSPARTPANRKPGTRTRWARRSSLIARGAAASRRGPVALLELLAAPARARIAWSHLLGPRR